METFSEKLSSAFEVKDHFNLGCYGTIYRVIKRSSGKMYAMKAIIRDSAGSSWKDIENDMQILSLANPYKPHLDSFFVSGNTLFMIIDYCGNGDLLKAIADKIEYHELFEEDEIWKYFIQICFGLESLHEDGFILCPQNILLDESKDIKLADLGISCSLPAKTVHENCVCQCSRAHSGDMQAKESDVWAVGCILYYLCSLEHPFEPHKPIWSGYSNDLRYFVDWCLKKQIERLTIVDILTHDFIINKTLSLSITIPQTSTMNATIHQIQLNKERESNEQLENDFSEYMKESMIPKNEIEPLKAEITHLSRIINEKGIENVRETKKLIASVPNPQISPATNDLNRKLEDIDVLRNKTAEILSRPKNWELEIDFRATCSAYQTNPSLHDPPLIQAYQDYLNAYQQKTSLYNFAQDSNLKTFLIIYNTETETQKWQDWQTLKLLNPGTCITQLPNSKLFCFGRNAPHSGITVLIDLNGGIEVLPSGTPYGCYSCVYFKNSIYCFGWHNNHQPLTLSYRFDLDQKRWTQLSPMPKADQICNTIIFNEYILISGWNRNLLLYSIDIDSFSIIPYEFAADKRKLLINADRLYLIECNDGSIYESEIGIDTNWRRIADSTIWIHSSIVYCSYNKRGIYIGESGLGYYAYFKFDLNKKRSIRLDSYVSQYS